MLSEQLINADLLDSGAAALVNPVNCVGAMGRGLALEFKKKFPQNFKAYKAQCIASQNNPAQLLGTIITPSFENGVWVLNLPTKLHFRDRSRLIWIISACKALDAFCQQHHILCCAVPALGCGLGGLDWQKEVLPVFKQILGPSSTQYLFFPPKPDSAPFPKAKKGSFSGG